MSELENLISKVNQARHQLISEVSDLSPLQANFKPSAEEWSVVDIIEHMVWAEQGGINGIWRAVEGIKVNKPVWEGENVNLGLTIEEVVDKTWQKKEKVPESAKPRWGGPLDFLIASLENCRHLLDDMIHVVEGMDFEKIIYPHVISGPLNIPQRMQFLRFHMERHQNQIRTLKHNPIFLN